MKYDINIDETKTIRDILVVGDKKIRITVEVTPNPRAKFVVGQVVAVDTTWCGYAPWYARIASAHYSTDSGWSYRDAHGRNFHEDRITPLKVGDIIP